MPKNIIQLHLSSEIEVLEAWSWPLKSTSLCKLSRTQFGFQMGDGGGDFWIWRVQLQASDAEIYHKDDQMAHSSRKPTDPGFSELLGTSLGMPLIVLGNYWSPTSAPPSVWISQANRLKFLILTFWFASLAICRNAPLRSSCCVRPAAACTCI